MVGQGWQKLTESSDTPTEQKAAQITHLFKVVVIGDYGVGKTSFIRRFFNDDFTESHISTIGVDFAIGCIISPNQEKIKLQLWDTATQQSYQTTSNSHYRGAHAICVMYDVTNRETFEDLKYQLEEVYDYAGQDSVIIIVGNKSESDDRKVSTEEAQKFAEEWKLPLMECSAKDDVNIMAVIELLTTKMLEQHALRREKSGKTFKNQTKGKVNISKSGSENQGKSKTCIVL